MERSIQRMELLINDLLNTSLVETGMFALRKSRWNLVELCQRIVEEHILGTNLQVTFVAPKAPIEAEVDMDRISQVLLNLLSNARKYSAPGSPVRLSLERSGDRCFLAVADQGVGIPADQLPHIFERFYRAPDIERQTGSSIGLGLGLYITHKIVELHGGRIEVDSLPGKGSTFTVILPLTTSEREERVASASSAESRS